MNKFVENIQCRDMSMYCVTTDHTPFHTPDDTRPMDGVVRTKNGGLEYYDAGVGDWFPLPGNEVSLELGPEARTVLDWAYEKILEEQQLEQLAKEYPALEKAKQNFELVKKMVLTGENNDQT